MSQQNIKKSQRHATGMPSPVLGMALLLMCASSLSAQASNSHGHGYSHGATQAVQINFEGHVNGKPVDCNQVYSGLGHPETSVRISDYRLFVSSPALVRADGRLQPIALTQDGKWQLDNVALLDFENGSSACNANGNPDLNTAIRGEVPAGDYVGLAFEVGVPFELNHGDPTLAAAPLSSTAMFWNWQNGYRFVRIDMIPVDLPADGPKGWFLHLGSTQCAAPSKTQAPSACANPNRMKVTFDAFDLNKNVVVIDPAPVVAQANLRVNASGTSPGCMSFPNDADCDTVMPKLGLPYGSMPAAQQVLLSIQ